MPAKLKVPTFTYGTYPSADGTPVKFDDALMRKLERNTNFLIQSKVLTPPVEYDWIDDKGTYHHGGLSAVNPSERTDAHGQIERVSYEDGVVTLHYGGVSEKLVGDIRAGKRIRSSGVFMPNYWYNDVSGKKVEIGPAIVGTSVLGSHRPAMRNPKIVPLSELQFGEEVSVVDAFHAREQLRASGVVQQTFDGDQYCFTEIEIDPKLFGEPKEQPMPMTAEEKAELQNMMKSVADTTAAPLIAKIAEQEQQIKKFSETAKREQAAHAFCEKLTTDRKAAGAELPKLFTEQAEKMLSDPSYTDAQIADIKLLCERAPSAFVKRGRADDNGGDNTTPTDEPKALSELRPKHFQTREEPASQQKIVDGLAAFSEFMPDAFKGIEGDPVAQTAKLHAYITTRDTVS